MGESAGIYVDYLNWVRKGINGCTKLDGNILTDDTRGGAIVGVNNVSIMV
jgi:hypothetical protein